jgi:Domain of unknown function (DUF6316)
MDRSTDNHVEVRFHADRFCRINSEWYYSMREQEGVGPFPTRESARGDLDLRLSALGRGSTDHIEVQCSA